MVMTKDKTAQKPKLSLHCRRSIGIEITKDKILHFAIPRLFILVMLQIKPEIGLKQVSYKINHDCVNTKSKPQQK
jgi:hypothetical protein